jgi:hypothetical protein
MSQHNFITPNTAAAAVFTVVRTPYLIHLTAVDKFSYHFYIRSTVAERKKNLDLESYNIWLWKRYNKELVQLFGDLDIFDLSGKVGWI